VNGAAERMDVDMEYTAISRQSLVSPFTHYVILLQISCYIVTIPMARFPANRISKHFVGCSSPKYMRTVTTDLGMLFEYRVARMSLRVEI
jgi:hypothetical protein